MGSSSEPAKRLADTLSATTEPMGADYQFISVAQVKELEAIKAPRERERHEDELSC